MIRKVLSVVAIAVVASSATAAPLTYAYRSTPIRAGVVLIDSQQTSTVPPTQANYNPYVFYNLEFNRTIKPGGWTFYNPSAPTRVTPEINTRWSLIDGAASAPVGDPITKRNGAYWEVRLSSISEAQISAFDILHLSAYGYISLNSLEREKLRRFMENGGVLWVDFINGVNFDVVNGFPMGFDLNNANLGITPASDVFHPLLATPNPVTNTDISLMESDNALGLRNLDLAALGFGDLQSLNSTSQYEFDRFSIAAEDARGPKIAMAAVGEGYLVVTTRGVAQTLNRVMSGGAYNNNRRSEALRPTFDRFGDAAAKLAVNMSFLSTSYNQSGKGARKTNSSNIDIGAPMLKRFGATGVTDPGGTNRYVPPAVYKGLVVISTRDQIFVYDGNPSSDLDNNGNPDDGVADYGVGANQDLVWSSRVLAEPISAPTAVEVVDSGLTRDQIAVVDGTGTLHIFDCFPAAYGTAMNPIQSQAAPTGIDPDFAVPGGGPYAPTFHDGQYFVADQITNGLTGIGRVWIADARNGQIISSSLPWLVGTTAISVMGRVSASPTVGYIPINDGSGGLDRVLYVPTRANTVGGPNSTAGVHSFWLGAKGEKPFSVSESAGTLFVSTRAQVQGLTVYNPGSRHPLGIKLTLIDAVGNPLPASTMDTLFTGAVTVVGGQIQFQFETGQSLPANTSVRIDYTIDWGVNQPGYGLQLLRGNVFLPDDSLRQRRILGNIALSPEGVIHVVHSDADAAGGITGGAYYAFREDRRGEFKLLNRYELYREHTINLNAAGPVSYRETLVDQDPVTTLPGVGAFLGGRFQTLRFTGGPTVRNGICYVMAQGTKAFPFIPYTIVMAFNANPPTPEVVVGDLPANFTVLQPDLARSDNKTSPTISSVLGTNNFLYEKPANGTSGVLRFENLMQSTRGAVGNSISLSQPLVLRVPGRPDQLIEPNQTASRWSPLLWYVVLHGFNGTSSALTTGNTLFFTGDSAVPWFIRNGFGPNVPTPSGVVYGLDADMQTNTSFTFTDPQRSWNKQIAQFLINPTFKGNPAVRWPQNEGATSFEEWGIRLLQTEIPGSTRGLYIGGGEDILAAVGNGGFAAFKKADFIVADENRLARFDASGNAIWSSDSSSATGVNGDTGAAIDTKPLVRPTKAYVVNSREMIVVDTGANRVLTLDMSGRETRSLDRFRLDPNFTPDGFQQGDDTVLKGPRDVVRFTSYQTNPSYLAGAAPLEYWVHYVIADTGNRRLIEVVDRYRANATTRRVEGLIEYAPGQPALGVLVWHTPSNLSGKDFDYNSLARAYVENMASPGNGRWVYAAGMGNVMPTRVDTGLDTPTGAAPRESNRGNGGLVIFDDATSIVVNQISLGPVPANAYWDFTSGAWNSAATTLRQKRLSNVSSVTMRNVLTPGGFPTVAIMFTDSEGVFEVWQPGSTGALDPVAPWEVRWFMPREAYRAIRRDVVSDVPNSSNPVDFRPTYARRLDSGEVLIVNGYIGRDRANNVFNGEVIQVDGSIDLTNNNAIEGFGFGKRNLGFKTVSIKAALPPIVGTRGIVLPVFADRR
jgi:hypothetical protein